MCFGVGMIFILFIIIIIILLHSVFPTPSLKTSHKAEKIYQLKKKWKSEGEKKDLRISAHLGKPRVLSPLHFLTHVRKCNGLSTLGLRRCSALGKATLPRKTFLHHYWPLEGPASFVVLLSFICLFFLILGFVFAGVGARSDTWQYRRRLRFLSLYHPYLTNLRMDSDQTCTNGSPGWGRCPKVLMTLLL